MKRFLIYAAIPALIILSACSNGNKNEVIKTTPEEILKAYQGGTSIGDQKFKDKKVEVTGVIDEVDRDVNGVPFVTFTLDNEVLPVFNFKKEQAKVVDSLKTGDKATLVCVGAGELLKTPTFNDCELAGSNVPAAK